MTSHTQNTKQEDPTTLEQIASVVGIVAAIWAVSELFKSIARKTDTTIISNDARRVLQDKDEAKKLRTAVDTYHATGNWEETDINDIL